MNNMSEFKTIIEEMFGICIGDIHGNITIGYHQGLNMYWCNYNKKCALVKDAQNVIIDGVVRELKNDEEYSLLIVKNNDETESKIYIDSVGKIKTEKYHKNINNASSSV